MGCRLFKRPTPDGLNYGFVASCTSFHAPLLATRGTFSTLMLSHRFDSPPKYVLYLYRRTLGNSPAVSISNVKLRFVVAAGTGNNGAPTQISPMSDIDGAPGYELPLCPRQIPGQSAFFRHPQ